ncbi:MAG TPA: hypothetical protein VFD30_18860 [Terriglobia bacterium]|jgi:hypothetical protein|nr:hypothetical protein [Terriglobia bacterium]
MSIFNMNWNTTLVAREQVLDAMLNSDRQNGLDNPPEPAARSPHARPLCDSETCRDARQQHFRLGKALTGCGGQASK